MYLLNFFIKTKGQNNNFSCKVLPAISKITKDVLLILGARIVYFLSCTEKFLSNPYYVTDRVCFLSARCIVNDQGKRDLLIIASFTKTRNSVEAYRIRRQIESMFRALKTSGFNIEKTHLTDIVRFEKLLAIVFIAFVWAYITGIYIDKKIKKIRMIKHGNRAKSFFKYGLDYITQWLINPYCKHNRNPIEFLSCT